MPAMQGEVVTVQNAEAEAERLINAIPVQQGLSIESSAGGDPLGIWREDADRFDLFFRGTTLRGSAMLAKRALARFFSIEEKRAAAWSVIQNAIVQALGIAPTPAANDAPALKN